MSPVTFWTAPAFAFNASLTASEASSSKDHPVRLSRVSIALPCSALALFLGLSVSGCVDTVGQARVESAPAATKIARRQGVSPRGATVALAAMDGAPQPVTDSFAADFSQVAPGLEITTAAPGAADYLVRGYLSAYADGPEATRFSYVLDLFDKQKRRVQRLTDDDAVKGAAADPWTLADAQLLHTLAQRSAGDLADALTNMPEAVAATAIASAAASGKPDETRISQSGTTALPRSVARAETSSPRLGLAESR